MLLAIDIGNSYIKCAVFEQNTLLQKFIFKQDEAQINFEIIIKKHQKIIWNDHFLMSLNKLSNSLNKG